MQTSTSSFLYCLKIAWPLVLAMTGNALMMFVDRLFLAHYSAVSIQAALPAGLVAFMVIALLQNVVSYSGTFVAQYAGAGSRAACARAMGQGLWLSLACVPILLATMPLGLWLFDLVGHAPDVLAAEKSYYLTLVVANLALPFGAALSGFFAGRGHTRLVMVANLIGNVANIVLDPLFIWGWGPIPELGIVGAGVATAIGQFLIVFILAAALCFEPHFSTNRRRRVVLAWKRPLAMRIVRFGIPNGGHVLLDVGTFTVFTFVTGWLDPIEFAASNIAFAINQLVFAPLMGIGMAASIVVGQRMGDRDPQGAARGGRLRLRPLRHPRPPPHRHLPRLGLLRRPQHHPRRRAQRRRRHPLRRPLGRRHRPGPLDARPLRRLRPWCLHRSPLAHHAWLRHDCRRRTPRPLPPRPLERDSAD